MPSEALLKLLQELVAAKDVLLPQIEGLEDFARLNIQETTRQNVQAVHADFVIRRDHINAAISALQALDAGGYPDVFNRMVAEEVFEDLKQNVDTIAAAFAKFTIDDRASDLGVAVGSPQPKP